MNYVATKQYAIFRRCFALFYANACTNNTGCVGWLMESFNRNCRFIQFEYLPLSNNYWQKNRFFFSIIKSNPVLQKIFFITALAVLL